MSNVTVSSPFANQVTQLKLAREIAADLHDLDTILRNYRITPEDWNRIKGDPNFLRLLESELASWHSAGNTIERTRIKSAAIIEEWLLEAHRLLHHDDEPLSSKTELAKLLARIGKLEQGGVGVENAGERFSVTINLGSDTQLRFEQPLPTKTITLEPGGDGA